MAYYICNRIGTGTINDPFRADIPQGTNHAATELKDGTFLVHSDAELTAKLITDVEVHSLIKKHNRKSQVDCTKVHNA